MLIPMYGFPFPSRSSKGSATPCVDRRSKNGGQTVTRYLIIWYLILPRWHRRFRRTCRVTRIRSPFPSASNSGLGCATIRVSRLRRPRSTTVSPGKIPGTRHCGPGNREINSTNSQYVKHRHSLVYKYVYVERQRLQCRVQQN